jgi:hypothetical protein
MPTAAPESWRHAFSVEWHCLLLLLMPVAKELLEHSAVVASMLHHDAGPLV